MPLVGDRVRLAPRPHRSFRRPLRRRLFHASAHAPAAAGRAPVDAPSSCTRPLFSPHPLDPTRRHPHRRRRRSPPFARRHGYCTAVVLCGRDVCAVRVYIGGKHLRKSTPFLERRILQVGVFGGSGEHIRWVLCVARYVFLQRTFSPWGARVGALGGQYGG